MSALIKLMPMLPQAMFIAMVIGTNLIIDVTKTARLKVYTSSGARLSIYKLGIASWWSYMLFAGLLISPFQLFTAVGSSSDMVWLVGSQVLMGIAITLLFIYFFLALMPAAHCFIRPSARLSYWKGLRPFYFLLPVAELERRWWVVVCITAGICEEIFFRGFVLQFIQGQSHGEWHLPSGYALLASSLVFGVCHYYQGLVGIIRTAVTGLLFGALVILSGSLMLAIFLHVMIDLVVLFIYKPQHDFPDVATKLIAGCKLESAEMTH